MRRLGVFFLLGWVASNGVSAWAQPLQLPTANRSLFEPGGEEKFFVPTVGKPWTSGKFGCVRASGWQMHEGLDIKCLQRDKRGEPIDPVMATADGTVAYLNTKPSLSNYGNYLILRHHIEGVEIYSLYAHLREVRSDLKIGHGVRGGEKIAVMGRTSNTHQAISKERAHVHFELNLFVNDRFSIWYQHAFPNQRNDHGTWNGQNLIGLDPCEIFLAQQNLGPKFSLLHYVRNRVELCRVLTPDTSFPWLRRYPMLVRRNPIVDKEGVVAYEIALNFNGLPFEFIPRARSELKSLNRQKLIQVNEAEYQKHPCRKLIVKHGSRWELTNTGSRLIELLTY